MAQKLSTITLALSLAMAGTFVAAEGRDNSGQSDSMNRSTRSGASPADRSDTRHDRNRERQSHASWELGDPLINLDAASLAAFEIGAEEFESVEDIEGGLGPIFNNVSCVACHSAGAVGGSSDEKVTRFGRVVDGQFDGFESAGGSLLQALSIDPAVAEVIPAEANITTQRLTTPLFGAGLIEAIDDETIRQNVERRKPDGITGRAAIVTDAASGEERVGRFGWKAQHATLLSFSGAAYRDEMGVTNYVFPTENAPNGNTALLEQYDQAEDIEDGLDPETGLGDVDHLANFMRFLAPPPPMRKSADAIAGEKLFEQVQCVACHMPTMITGPNEVAALANQQVNLYSDLLLHDMGELADGIAQDGAGMQEIRTAPLWGIASRTSFLHDGRATTIIDAINQHAGEAAGPQSQFAALSTGEQAQIIEFLKSN